MTDFFDPVANARRGLAYAGMQLAGSPIARSYYESLGYVDRAWDDDDAFSRDFMVNACGHPADQVDAFLAGLHRAQQERERLDRVAQQPHHRAAKWLRQRRSRVRMAAAVLRGQHDCEEEW